MGSKCVVCHDRPQQFRCIQCHKPVCNECAFKTEHGVFCGRDCAGAYREYQRAAGPVRRSGGGLKTLVILILIAAAAAVLAWRLNLLARLLPTG
jgi:hypothetical protein